MREYLQYAYLSVCGGGIKRMKKNVLSPPKLGLIQKIFTESLLCTFELYLHHPLTIEMLTFD